MEKKSANRMTVELEQIQALHSPGQKLMGLDLGSKTIGIAFSDTELNIASARQTLVRKKFSIDAAELIDMAVREHVFAIVLGLPLNMDGSEGPRAQSTRSFARNFAKLDDAPPILFWDERLSTVAAERAMLEADISRKKRAEKIDSIAAAIILQGALDRLAAIRRP